MSTKDSSRSRGYRVHYRIFRGDGDRTPVLAIHGDTGQGSASLDSFAAIAERGRTVVVYNQLGGGRSDLVSEEEFTAFATIEMFVEELETVRRTLELEQIHLLGHSWGGRIALEYVLGGAPAVRSLTMLSSYASQRLFASEFVRLVKEMPPDQYTALREQTRSIRPISRRGGVSASNTTAACCRGHRPMPHRPSRTSASIASTRTTATGTCSIGSTRSDFPMLALSGRHDVVTPLHGEAMAERMADCRVVVLERQLTLHIRRRARGVPRCGERLLGLRRFGGARRVAEFRSGRAPSRCLSCDEFLASARADAADTLRSRTPDARAESSRQSGSDAAGASTIDGSSPREGALQERAAAGSLRAAHRSSVRCDTA